MICHGRLVSSLPLLFILTACGGAHSGWKSFPVTIYADQKLVQSSTFDSDFQDAMNFWETKAGKKLFNYQGAYSGNTPYTGAVANPDTVLQNVVFSQNPWPFAQTIVGQTMVTSTSAEIQAAMVMINPDTQFCGGDCVGQDSFTSERKVLAHELGHFLGLQHVSDPANLMYPTSLPGGSLDSVTIDETTFKTLVTGN